jgi:hypothetical protein
MREKTNEYAKQATREHVRDKVIPLQRKTALRLDREP